MKKVILGLILMLTAVFANAEEWGFTCTNDEVLAIAPDNMEIIAKGSLAMSAIDTKLVKVDKKNKTVSVWVTYIGYPEMARTFINDYGYTQVLGYTRQLKVYNIATNKVKIDYSAFYKCNGTSIEAYGGDNKWDFIIPNSVDESMVAYLKKAYLK